MPRPTIRNPDQLPYPVLVALRHICGDLSALFDAMSVRNDGTFSYLRANGLLVETNDEVPSTDPDTGEEVTLPPGTIAFASLPNMPEETVLGRGEGNGAGSPQVLTLGDGMAAVGTQLRSVASASTLRQAMSVASLRP